MTLHRAACGAPRRTLAVLHLKVNLPLSSRTALDVDLVRADDFRVLHDSSKPGFGQHVLKLVGVLVADIVNADNLRARHTFLRLAAGCRTLSGQCCDVADRSTSVLQKIAAES